MTDMSQSTLTVERVFPVSFGPMVWGTFTGNFRVGDRLLLERSDGTRATGNVKSIDPHRPAHARKDQISIGVRGEVADVVRAGDVLQFLGPEENEIPRG